MPADVKSTESQDYKSTVFLPKTGFAMKAGLPQREPEFLARWAKMDLFTRQLGDILTYVEQIRSLDTTGVEPTSQVLNRPVDRDDAPGPNSIL